MGHYAETARRGHVSPMAASPQEVFVGEFKASMYVSLNGLGLE